MNGDLSCLNSHSVHPDQSATSTEASSLQCLKHMSRKTDSWIVHNLNPRDRQVEQQLSALRLHCPRFAGSFPQLHHQWINTSHQVSVRVPRAEFSDEFQKEVGVSADPSRKTALLLARASQGSF